MGPTALLGGKLLNIKYVLTYTTFVRNIYHSSNNSARYCHKRTQVLM